MLGSAQTNYRLCSDLLGLIIDCDRIGSDYTWTIDLGRRTYSMWICTQGKWSDNLLAELNEFCSDCARIRIARIRELGWILLGLSELELSLFITLL